MTTLMQTGLETKHLAAQCHWKKLLGIGGFGRVDQVLWKNDKLCALKTVEFTTDQVKSLAILEVNHSQLVSHENIVNVHAVEVDNEGGRAHILMEHCAGGTLLDILFCYHSNGTRLPLDDAWSYFIQIAKALRYLHTPCFRKGVLFQGALAHRDIKPENILFADPGQHNLKLADLGLAKHFHPGEVSKGRTGSYPYMAPEVITGNAYDARADCYSLGIVAYEMLNGVHPFAGQTEAQVLERHQERWSMYDDPDYERDPGMAEIIEDLMHRDPARRLTIDGLFNNSVFLKKLMEHELAIRDRALANMQARMEQQEARHERQLRAQAEWIANLEFRAAVVSLYTKNV